VVRNSPHDPTRSFIGSCPVASVKSPTGIGHRVVATAVAGHRGRVLEGERDPAGRVAGTGAAVAAHPTVLDPMTNPRTEPHRPDERTGDVELVRRRTVMPVLGSRDQRRGR
jgi:hypothetical protein